MAGTVSTTMPTTGQFVAVWYYNGAFWSGVLKWENRNLFRYCDHNDEWEFTYYSDNQYIEGVDSIFYICDEE